MSTTKISFSDFGSKVYLWPSAKCSSWIFFSKSTVQRFSFIFGSGMVVAVYGPNLGFLKVSAKFILLGRYIVDN